MARSEGSVSRAKDIEVYSENWGWVPAERRGEPDEEGAFYVVMYPPGSEIPRHTYRTLAEEGTGWRYAGGKAKDETPTPPKTDRAG